jgi:serine/threonine protein kinase
MSRQIIEGKYEIIGEQGAGGMGKVYKAVDITLNRTVALKFLSSDLTRNVTAQGRFQDEMLLHAKLNHPSLATIYASGQWNGQPYFVMEFIDSGSLEDILRESGPMPVEVAVPIVSKVLEAIEHAHTNRVVHRDLKPSNILFTRDGQPKVIDFGIAFAEDSERRTVAGDVNCTPVYASPEQAAGKTAEIDELSDVYSLGVVLYEMLTGKPPIDRGSNNATLVAKATEDAPPLPDHFGPALVATVSKSLEREKAKRFQNAGEFRVALASTVSLAPRESNPVKAYITKSGGSRPTVVDLKSRPSDAGLKIRHGVKRRRISWMVYASVGVLAATAVGGWWVVREVRQRLAPLPPLKFRIQPPLPPSGWDIITLPKIMPLKTDSPPTVVSKAPQAPSPKAPQVPQPIALSADERAELEGRRVNLEVELKRQTARLTSLKAVGENPAEQSRLDKVCADLREQLDAIARKLSAR